MADGLPAPGQPRRRGRVFPGGVPGRAGGLASRAGEGLGCPAPSRGESLPAVDWDALPGSSPLPSQGAEDAERAESLRAALAALPPKQAEAFSLHHLEGWSYREIAGHLSSSVDAVGLLLHRARKRLRELLESSAEAPRVAGRGPVPRPGSASLPEEPR